ncbi:hypothetical protein O3P69_014659 [Scylla paramamosain]|uniref:Uncharacterized protein n=1 Tax=Scylla paramamosain TaxID=85552 RepID=A0AAW0TXG0_SCYPA
MQMRHNAFFFSSSHGSLRVSWGTKQGWDTALLGSRPAYQASMLLATLLPTPGQAGVCWGGSGGDMAKLSW